MASGGSPGSVSWGVSGGHATVGKRQSGRIVPRKVSKILFSDAVLEVDAGAAGALLEVKYLLRRRDMLEFG